ncbi:MAG: divalent-cation tolerance protein CutA [Candidatus Bathyarchaeota archaeon]|jgi:periplasmic divalent cation tolerance protein
MSYLIVLMTTSNKEEAENIVRALLEDKLIACANIIESVSSFFWWQGKIESEKEALIIIKTNDKLFEKLQKRITALHSYDVPEILALPIVAASQSYLDWLKVSLESVK